MEPIIKTCLSQRSMILNLVTMQSIAKGQADTRTELIVEKARMKSMIYAVLTPEQRTKAEQIRESWKARHEKEHKHKD